MDPYFERWGEHVIRDHPELWSFFEGSSEYPGQSVDDPQCKRWQDIITLSYIIHISGSGVLFRCEPGKMSLHDSYTYRGHDGETDDEYTDYYVEAISKEDYDRIRGKKMEESFAKGAWWMIERVFYLEHRLKEYLDEDYLPVQNSPYSGGFGSDSLEIAATVKGVPGYYLFKFTKD